MVAVIEGQYLVLMELGVIFGRNGLNEKSGTRIDQTTGIYKSDDSDVKPVNGTRAISNQATVARDRKRRAVCTRSEARDQIVRLSLKTAPRLE
jgi:hypothetical protein